EVEAVARDTADAIERHPFDELGIDPALQDKIFEQPSHVVFGEGGANSSLQSEAASQSARDVVFTAAFPDRELTRSADTPLAGVEAEHDLAQREHVVFAGTGRLNFERA